MQGKNWHHLSLQFHLASLLMLIAFNICNSLLLLNLTVSNECLKSNIVQNYSNILKRRCLDAAVSARGHLDVSRLVEDVWLRRNVEILGDKWWRYEIISAVLRLGHSKTSNTTFDKIWSFWYGIKERETDSFELYANHKFKLRTVTLWYDKFVEVWRRDATLRFLVLSMGEKCFLMILIAHWCF